MRKLLILSVLLLASLFAEAQTMSLTQSGTGKTATVTVVSSGQFKLVWEAADNWGLSQWYDLITDSGATTNLAGPTTGVSGGSCSDESGMAQYVFYSEGDEKAFMREVDTGCTFPSASPTMTVLVNTPTLIELQTVTIPVSPSTLSTDLSVTTTYYIYPNGKIYVHEVLNASGPINLGVGSGDYVMMLGLPDQYQTGTIPPDTQSIGWVRASTTQNPYNYVGSTEQYLYTYWGSTSGAWGYGSSIVPKASLMIVPSPNNNMNGIGQLVHSWSCGTNCGVVRWGYHQGTGYGANLTAGQSVTYDWLLQLGTQGSNSLPNMTTASGSNCDVCSTIAMSYIRNPTPPSGELLANATPNSFSTPSGWTVFTTQDFESGSFGTGAYGNGNFSTTQAHNDGNVAHTHSIECQIGGQPDCSGGTAWIRPLPVGTKEVYISFYEWLDSSFRMNDEMFLTRFWWNTGTGQPSFKEAILDYFQDSTLTYNSNDATLLWNIQGTPYYQNKFPTNMSGDSTNFTFTTGAWVHHEIYAKFSTLASAVSIPGTVTLNATARTYTCSACNWSSLGIQVGDSPHFTGFTGGANNADGSGGGGGYSYFVNSMTPTVLSMSAMPYASNEGPISGATVQVDHADGAYQYYKDGALVAHQTAMIFPGGVDFSTQATNLSIGESYSKNIWHAGPETSAPFSSACSSGIFGVGYDNLAGLFGSGEYGWNGSGLTATSQANLNAGIFSAHIDCDATWGGPMPTPPVFKRYLDDIIVLTKSGTSNPFFPLNRGFGKVSVRGGSILIR